MAAGGGGSAVPPAFTKGATICEQAKHDWNLGATRIRGWRFIDKLETTQARQIAVTPVAPNSPADGKIVVADVIPGVAGQQFPHDPRVEFGRTFTAAETETGKPMLTGKRPNIAPQIDAATAKSLIDDGRGWSNTDRNGAYDKLDPGTLLEKLGSWSPTVRERASIAISRIKGDKPIAAIVSLLDSPNLYARY